MVNTGHSHKKRRKCQRHAYGPFQSQFQRKLRYNSGIQEIRVFRKFGVLEIRRGRAEDLELKMSGRYVIFIFIITIITLIILFPYSPWLVGQDEDCIVM